MKKRNWHTKGWPATPMLAALISLGVPAVVHASPAQSQNSQPAQNSDITRQELAKFDQFLDSHREISEQVRQNPSLVNNDQFVKNHPALQSFMQQHPTVREELKENPNAFMHREARYDRQEDRMRDERLRFNGFLDSHREIAEQLRKDPKLINDAKYVNEHPELQTYLQQHPEFQEAAKKDPDAFTRADKDRYARHDNDARDRDARADNDNRDRDERRDNDARHDNDNSYNHHDADDRDAHRDELANFDRYLDSHRETAEQIRKDPSLVNNDEFVKNHPSLQSYLQQHPGVRTAIKQNPNAFMQQEARYDQNEYRMRSGEAGEPHRHFGEFLGGHSSINEQLSKDPSLVKNEEYMQSHPELKDYLNQHPDVRQGLMQNPESFVKTSQQFNTTNKNGSYSGAAQTTTPATGSKPATDPTKPKQ
jgi:phage-related protein